MICVSLLLLLTCPRACVPVCHGGHMEVRGQHPYYFHLPLCFEIVLFAELAGLQNMGRG